MSPDEQTEYIVLALREAGRMYEDGARKFLGEHDAHVRAAALAEIADRLARRATLYGDSQTVIEVIKDLRQLAEAKAATEGTTVLEIPTHSAPEFFEPGRTYLHHHGWKFRCDAVTTHPVTGKRVAVGYSVFGHDDCQTSDLGDGAWADGEWTDVTGSGEGQ